MSEKALALVGGKAKIGAISLLLILLVGTGAYYLATNPNAPFSFQEKENLPRIDWTPRAPPTSPQSGLNSWMRGESSTEMSQSLGSYIGMSGSNIFGLANELATVSEEAVATLNESEAISIAMSHSKVNQFVENYKQIDTWTYFDGTFWHIDFTDADAYEDWAYIMIRDKDAQIVQVYIFTEEGVYLEWPTANLDAGTALGLANENSIILEFLEANSLNITDAWVWFDGDRSWYIDFYPYVILYAEDTSVSLNNRENIGTEQEWGEILPSQPMEDRLAYGEAFNWLTAVVDDVDARVTSVYTSYFDFQELNRNPEAVRNAAKTAPEAKDFWDRHAGDYISQDVYLQFNYSSADSSPQTIWWVDNYVWPQSSYLLEGSADNNFGSVQLPSEVKGFYYWAFDYMTIALTDSALETVFIYELPQPEHSYEEVLQIILDQLEISEFITTYQEVWISVTFDPFTSTWWSWVAPTWTWMAYAFLEIADDASLTINDLWVEDIPAEQTPRLTVNEARAIFQDSPYFEAFNQTYSEFGDVIEYAYYYYDARDYNSNAKIWTFSVYSPVIIEAYLSVSIDDETGEIIEQYSYDPEVLPVHSVEEVLNFTQQHEAVQEFLNANNDVVTNIFFLSYDPYGQTEARWLVYYYTPQYDAVIALEVRDDPLTVMEVWTYP